MYRYNQKTYAYPAMLGKVMYAIKDDPTLLALVLQDAELGRWWKQRRDKELKRIEKEEAAKRDAEEKARLEVVKHDLLLRLTEDEKKALGLSKVTS